MMGATRFVLLLSAALMIGALSAELIKRDQYLYGLGLALSGGTIVMLLAK